MEPDLIAHAEALIHALSESLNRRLDRHETMCADKLRQLEDQATAAAAIATDAAAHLAAHEALHRAPATLN
jgi:hypothetical protein